MDLDSNSNEAQQSAASAETSSLSDQPKATGTATVAVTQSVNLRDYTAPTDQALYIHTDCDALQASDQQTQLANGRTDNYSVQCYKDLVRFTGGIGIDIFAVTTYSLDDCMRVCSTYNQNSNSIGCKAVSFNSCKGSSFCKIEMNETWTRVTDTFKHRCYGCETKQQWQLLGKEYY